MTEKKQKTTVPKLWYARINRLEFEHGRLMQSSDFRSGRRQSTSWLSVYVVWHSFIRRKSDAASVDKANMRPPACVSAGYRVCLSVHLPHTQTPHALPFSLISVLPACLSVCLSLRLTIAAACPHIPMSVHSAAAVTSTMFRQWLPGTAHHVLGRHGTLSRGHAGQGRPGCVIRGPMPAAPNPPTPPKGEEATLLNYNLGLPRPVWSLVSHRGQK